MCQNFHLYGTKNALCTLHDMYAIQLNQLAPKQVAGFGKSLYIIQMSLLRVKASLGRYIIM